MSLNNDDDKGTANGTGGGAGGLPDLQSGSDPNGLAAGLMGLQQQQGGNNGGNDANASSLMGGMSAGMMGGQSGADGQKDANSIVTQQQALMAMAAGNGGAGAGLDNGNKDALMNLLAKQGKSRNFVC